MLWRLATMAGSAPRRSREGSGEPKGSVATLPGRPQEVCAFVSHRQRQRISHSSKTISTLYCNVLVMIFRKTPSSGLGTRSWRRRWSPWGRRWEPSGWPRGKGIGLPLHSHRHKFWLFILFVYKVLQMISLMIIQGLLTNEWNEI